MHENFSVGMTQDQAKKYFGTDISGYICWCEKNCVDKKEGQPSLTLSSSASDEEANQNIEARQRQIKHGKVFSGG